MFVNWLLWKLVMYMYHVCENLGCIRSLQDFLQSLWSAFEHSTMDMLLIQMTRSSLCQKYQHKRVFRTHSTPGAYYTLFTLRPRVPARAAVAAWEGYYLIHYGTFSLASAETGAVKPGLQASVLFIILLLPFNPFTSDMRIWSESFE